MRNLSGADCHFGVHLIGVDPPSPGLVLPLPLQITNEPATAMAVLPGKQARPIDVFLWRGPSENVFHVTGAYHNPTIAAQTCRLTLCAHCLEGVSSERVFVVNPGDQAAVFRAVP